MSDLRIKRGTSSVSRATEDLEWGAARGTRDGALFQADWIQGLCMEGRVFCANGGTVTTPVTFHNDTLAGTEPEFAMSVPSGTTVIPLDISLQLEAYGTTLLYEVFASVGTGGVLGTDDDLTAGTNICNLRTDAPYTSNCTIGISCDTGTATYQTGNVSEFWRDGLQKAVTLATATDDMGAKVYNFNWNAEREGFFPVLVGASQLFVHSTCQAPTGFITVIYAEVPSSSIV